MKISTRVMLFSLSIFLSLFLVSSAEFRVSDGLFTIDSTEIIFEDSSYFLEVVLNKDISEEITFDVEILNREENIVVSNRKFSCNSYSCTKRFRIGRTIFGEHELFISTKYQRNTFKQKKRFELKEIINLDYLFTFPQKLEIREESSYATFVGKIQTKIPSKFIFDIFPISIPENKVSFSVFCEDLCSISQNLSQPLILGDYRINVYSDLGESLYDFKLEYFDESGDNSGAFEDDDSELLSIIGNAEVGKNSSLSNKKSKTIKTKSLFHSTLKDKDKSRNKFEVKSKNKNSNNNLNSDFNVFKKIQLDGTQEDIILEKNSELNLSTNSSFGIYDENTDTRLEEVPILETLERSDLNQSDSIVYTNLNNREEYILLNNSNITLSPGIYRGESSYGEKSYFAYGLVSINTKKPLYAKGEIMKFIIVVLDTQGYLVSSSNISLEIENPSGEIILLSSESRSIIESKKPGVYFAYLNASQIGRYNLSVSTQVDGFDLILDSYVNVVDEIFYEILRFTPATIDPNLGPFKNEFSLSNFIVGNPITLRESVPASFEILDTNANRIEMSEDLSRKYLFWDDVEPQGDFFYYSQTPLISPFLYELGRAQVFYGNEDYFLENRSWLFAIDPLQSGTTRTCSDTFGFDCSLWPATSEGDNTFDTCPSGVGGAADEHVDGVQVNNSLLYFGESVEISCTFDPYSAGSEEYIYYYDGISWTQVYAGNAPDGNVHQVTQIINVSSNPGTHYARCIIDWDGEADSCAETGQYYDNDDVSFEVVSPFLDVVSPQNISYSTPLISLEGTTTQISTISYSINGGASNTICSSCSSFNETLFLLIGSYDIEITAIADSSLEENIWIQSFSVTNDVINPPVNLSKRTCSDTFGFDCSLWPATSEGDNTFDTCPSGAGGAADEHVDEVFLNSSLVYGGDNVGVTCQFDPYDAGTEEYIYYYDGISWTQVYAGNAPSGNVHNVSVSINVSSNPGTHYARCIVDWDGEADSCANGGSYYDNDDASFEVAELVSIPFTFTQLSPLPINYSMPAVTFSGTTSKNASISYQLNGGSVESICNSCTNYNFDLALRNDNYSLLVMAQDLDTLEYINYSTNFSVNFVDPGTLINTSGRTCSDTFGFDCSLWPATSEGDNTFDSCSSGLGGAADEHVDEVQVNMSGVYFGTSIEVTCFYDPYDAGTELYMYYYNTSGWSQVYAGNAPSGNPLSISQSFVVDNLSGTHYARCIADWDGEADSCANVGQYYDNDDVSFEVFEPIVIPYIVSLNSPVDNSSLIDTKFLVDVFATKPSDFSYSINGGSYIPLCSNCSNFLSNISIAAGNYNFSLRALDIETSNLEFISRSFTLTNPLNISYSNFDGNTTDFTSILDITNACNIVLENSSSGKIEFDECINADNSNLDLFVSIRDNVINVDSTNIPNYNVSANLSFYNINYVDPIVLLNSNEICLSCSILNYSGGVLEVRAPHFSSYSVVENRSLEIFDYTDFFPVGINSEVGFYANYSYVNSTPISDATCQIQFNTNGSYGAFSPMNYNVSIDTYDFYQLFPSAGNFNFNVSCSHPSFPDFNLEDSFVISPPSTLSIDLVNPSTSVSNIYTNSQLITQFNISCIGALECSGVDLSLFYEGPENLGEAGAISLSNNERIIINFSKPYLQTPVAILTPASDNGSDNNALIPVIHSINTTAMEISLCEDAGASTCSSTVESELVHYMVFDIDIANKYLWIDVGRVAGVPTTGADTPLTFSGTFTNIPSVFAQAQTYSSASNQIAPSGWTDSITTSGAQIIGCDHPGTTNSCAGTFSETYGYVAIDMNLHDITSLSSGVQSVSNSLWTPISYGQSYTSPIISVFQNSDTGAQDPQYPWARNVGPAGADVRYCEQDGAGDCDTHSAELIHWFTLEEGMITTSATSGSIVSDINDSYPLFVQTNPQLFNVAAGSSTLRNFSLETTANRDSLFTLFGLTNYGPQSENFTLIVKESFLNSSIILPLNDSGVVQNQSFEIRVALNCTGDCGDVEVSLFANSSQISNISSANPFYIIGPITQTCSVATDSNCEVLFDVNATGVINSNHRFFARINSNVLSSFDTKNIVLEILDGPKISFTNSELNFSEAIANYEDSLANTFIEASVQDHGGVNVFCLSGDCSSFSSNFVNGGSVFESNNSEIEFTCSPSSAGNYSAVFSVVSNEDLVGDVINLNCEATELPLFLNLINPSPDAQFDIVQNDTFSIVFNVTCNDIIDCNDVNLTLYYEQDSIGEAGAVVLENFETKTITFEREYSSTPIVIATPASDTNSDNNALIPVITSITTNGFDIALCEDAGASTCSGVVESELVHYMVFDIDIANSYSWIDVGAMPGVVTNGGDNLVNFGKTFTNNPYVFAQVQGDNDGGTAIAPSGWAHSITTTSAQLIGCDHPGVGDVCAGTTTETFGYVAIDFLSANLSVVSSGVESIPTSSWRSVSFSQTYSNPIISVFQNSDSGGQDPQYPWARSVTSTQADVRYCEQDGAGDCDSHNAESVVWFALEEGLILIGDKDQSRVSTISSSSPFYSNINPDIFNISSNSSTLISFILNASGAENTREFIYGELGNLINSKSLEIRILGENELYFLDENIAFDVVYEGEGSEINSSALFSKYSNTNININCILGNCSSFSTSFVNGNSLVENQSEDIFFTCQDVVAGNLSAVFEVSSNEVGFADNITLSCSVLVKTLDIDLVNPLPLSTTQTIQNSTINVSVNITCQDSLGCNNINSSLYFDDLSKLWHNRSYDFRQNISFISPATTTNNFVFLLELNSSNVGSNFNWDNNCADLLFVISGVELDYYLDYCNLGSQRARVFVESNTPLINSQPYSFEMYYGNEDAVSLSSGENTFLFFEDFENYVSQADNTLPTSWSDLASGDVRLYTEANSNRALIKDTNNDPNGGFVDFGFTLNNIEIYAKTNRINTNGGAANRYSITDLSGNGYGPYTANYGASTSFLIESRTSNGGATLFTGSNFATTQNAWYTQRFSYFNQNIEFDFFDSTYNILNSISGVDSTYSSFERFNVHGGNEFLSDDIFAREYFGGDPSFSFSLEERRYSLISNISTTPIYIMNSNPQTIYLLNGESVVLEYELNASGDINTSYDIFGELSNLDRTEFTTIEIIDDVNFETNLSIEIYSTYLGSNSYDTLISLNNLLESQTSLDGNITLHLYVPNYVNLSSFDIGSSLRYGVVSSQENINNVYLTNGTIYEFELYSLMSNQGVFSAYTGSRTLDNSWDLRFNITSLSQRDFFEEVLVGLE